MVLIRYVLYFLGIAFLTFLLTRFEIVFPGAMRFEIFTGVGDMSASSEFSPVEYIQWVILIVCGLLHGWVALRCPAQRPVALPFGGLALIFFVRELDYFLDRYVAENFWQSLIAVVAALIIVYVYRHKKRFRIAWLRIWPSPGLTMLFAGAIVMFVYSTFLGQEALWESILDGDYRRVVPLAVGELLELIAYSLWLIGSIEFAYQARAIAMQEPQTAAAKKRAGRHPKSEGRF